MALAWLAGCAAPPPSARLTYWAAADGSPQAEGAAESKTATRMAEGDDLYDAQTGRVRLSAAINETVAFRLWIAYSGATAGEVSVSVEDWRSGDATLAADAVTIYRAHAVRVPRWPGWHIRSIHPSHRRESVDDVLIPAEAPLRGLPATMSNGETLALWIDVRVPKGTPPGLFGSRLGLRCDGAPNESVELELKVLPFVLPDRPELVLAADLDHQALFTHHVTYRGEPCRAERVLSDSPVRSELQAVLDAAMRLLHAHEIVPLLPALYPTVKTDAQDEVSVLWDDYDRTVEGYLDGTQFVDRVGLPIWVMPFDEGFPAPPSYDAIQSPTYARHLREYLSHCANHFSGRGWLERSFVELPYSDKPSPDAARAGQYFARVIRKADSRLRILSNLFPQDLAPYGWPDFPTADLLGYVDIWCPAAQFYLPPDPIGPLGKVKPAEMWMRVDRPPFSGSIDLAAPAADTRVLPWQAQREGVPVVRLGEINHWPDAGGEVTAQACVDAADAAGGRPAPLIYPGTIAGLSEPVPSVRLKRLRRAMQDMAYVKLMRSKGLAHTADILAESLAPFAGAKAYRHHYADPRAERWPRDSRWWRDARRIMADELVAVLQPGSMDAGGPTPTYVGVRWERFTDAVRRVYLTTEGVRVRPAPLDAHGAAASRGSRPPASDSQPRAALPVASGGTVECTLVIENRTSRTLAGSMDFGELPVGWSGLNTPWGISVPPGGSSRVILEATVQGVTWNDEGVRYLPIVFAAEDGTVHEARVRMAFMAAQWASDPIRIDGELSDWPPSVANLASDFVLISGAPVAVAPGDAGSSSARPQGRTRVYAAADAEALYFAFDCTSGADSLPPTSRGNVVVYDDLIPQGEELVEIVLDPNAMGTHSPEDLYHLVIKPSGALWEIGVGTDPPVGRRRIWGSDIRHAARTENRRWQAEVRIPFSAFSDAQAPPAAGGSGRIWAVNFSRFDAQSQEYSNWAGAARNFYDPASLGNLALP